MKIVSIDYNYEKKHPFYTYQNVKIQYWTLLLIKSQSHIIISDKDYIIQANTLIIIEANIPVYVENNPYKLVYDSIIFSPLKKEKALLEQLPLNQPINICNLADLSFLIKNMCFEFYSLNTYKTENINYYFKILLNKIIERIVYFKPPSAINVSNYINELMYIRKKIYTNPEKKWSIDELTKYLPVSRSRFQHLYTQTFGVSITKDIKSIRLKKACDLLLTTNMTVHDISIKCGYESSSYFMKIFKSTYNTTPSLYRNKNK